MKSILITGTNRGIGLGIVKALVKGEYNTKYIIATCRKPNEAYELQTLADQYKNIHILQLDVQQFSGYGEFVSKVTNIVQKDGLNVLINNAGISHKFVRIGYLKHETMLEAFTVNCVAPTIMSKELLPLLKQSALNNENRPLGSERAAILNISSQLGSISENVQGGFYPYRCSKAALNAATKSLSIDLQSYNIITACLHPGWVRTRMGGPKAPLEIDEACTKIIDVIKNLNIQHNGKFICYDGKELNW